MASLLRPIIRWFGPQVEDHIRKQVVLRLKFACEKMANYYKKALSKSTRAHGPSKAGEDPHADTGKLRQSIAWHVDEKTLVGTVGTDKKYGLWLEYGIPGGKVIVPKRAKMLSWINSKGERVFAKSVVQGAIAPRRWLSRGITIMQPVLKKIFEAPLPDRPGGSSFTAEVAA